MKLLTQIKSGALSLEEVLKKNYPDLQKVRIEKDNQTDISYIVLEMKDSQDRRVMIRVGITQEALEGNSAILGYAIENAIMKLRKNIQTITLPVSNNNPSSRGFGC